jgi:solute carrier family 20 (sodium-dependent phosphate transporter)
MPSTQSQIAAVFEFVGAMVLGRVSTSVISGGIANVSTFSRDPDVLAYGMVCAMTVSGVWQILASYCELNVSSTHSIIGSIIGFALVYGGNSAVLWKTEDPASFPPYKVWRES